MEITSAMNPLRSASARRLDFGEKTTLNGNRAERKRTKNVKMDCDTGYAGHEEIRWHFGSAAEKSIWERNKQ
jgi:hypothetical protein